MSFGRCTDDPDTVGGIPVNKCSKLLPPPDDPTGPVTDNFDLGPGVKDAFDSTNKTYVIEPNLDPAPGTPLPPDTMMVVLSGFFRVGSQDSLNNNDGTVALGVIDFDIAGNPPQAIPGLTFQGTELLPGFENGPFQLVGDAEPTNGDAAGIEAGGSESTDFDEDGRGDNADNCTKWYNPNQEDTGGVRLVDAADGIGTLCQCGDSGGDGTVDNGFVTGDSPTPEDDVTKCQEALAGALTGSEQEIADQLARCAVTGGATATIVDLLVMERELEDPGSAGTPIEQVCVQANE
jgi:hypothetical protein